MVIACDKSEMKGLIFILVEQNWSVPNDVCRYSKEKFKYYVNSYAENDLDCIWKRRSLFGMVPGV